METKNLNWYIKKWGWPIIALLFLVGIVFASGTLPKIFVSKFSPSPTASQAVTLKIDYGDGTSATITDYLHKENETLFEFMKFIPKKDEKQFIEYKEYSGLGVLITRIGSKSNGEEDKYWQYLVNGEFAKVGADSYILGAGDIVEWKFQKPENF
ncbi:MAG: DUF4430 domain-containing protein [Parcubacteria group bacterium]|nr:DUF4430 domain-containing protein [Parcubacteria group bacterium]